MIFPDFPLFLSMLPVKTISTPIEALLKADPLWYKDAVFYELYIRAFKDSSGDGNGDIQGLIKKLDYLQDLGINCIWVLPMYPSPLVDDGYDISEYYDIHPDYGTLNNFTQLVEAVHKKGMRIITDLVMNHTSNQHPWFQAARSDKNSQFRDYYVWSDTDQKYPEARVIFNDSLNSNWTWDEIAEQYYWHRFYPEQPDLNYDNPAVQGEMFKIIDFWLNLGIDGFRADAVPYLFEREGTNCDNLPETHQFLKQLRNFMNQKYPDKIMLLEANQWPEDVRNYFADGDEAHMAFHFPVMPRLYMALRKGDRSDIVDILDRTPPIPNNCQWCTFLRNHDELTLEMVTEVERQWMWKEYAPDPRMRLNLGIRRRLSPLLDNDLSRIKLINALLFSLPGSPIIYYGDEIGMGDNIHLPDRDGVRTPMQWNNGHNAGFSSSNKLYSPVNAAPPFSPAEVNVAGQQADPASLYSFTKKIIAVRKKYQAFSRGDFYWADLVQDNPSIAAYWRTYEQQIILVINNLSHKKHQVGIKISASNMVIKDMFSKKLIHSNENKISVSLDAFQFLWLAVQDV